MHFGFIHAVTLLSERQVWFRSTHVTLCDVPLSSSSGLVVRRRALSRSNVLLRQRCVPHALVV